MFLLQELRNLQGGTISYPSVYYAMLKQIRGLIKNSKVADKQNPTEYQRSVYPLDQVARMQGSISTSNNSPLVSLRTVILNSIPVTLTP